ncbi:MULTISPECIES: MAB_1171c family putative transporter [Streptomyces]|uniref:MAB_1171c family putative transporter n=1 Tax=Streptomyces TaxID=1883 RepID=UPI000B9E9879|nr:MAB_1171c family putative transporter [Streptomyces kasugaensis]
MTAIKLTIVVLLWMVALWRLPAAIRRPQQRSMWVAFTGLAAAITSSVPLLASQIDNVTGVNNASVLAKHMVGIVAIGAVLDFVIAMAHPHLLKASRKPIMMISACIMIVMVSLYSAVPQPARVENFYEAYRDNAFAVGYCLTFVVYLALATAMASWMCLSYSRYAARSWLRAGLRLLGAGTGIGAVYSLFRAAHLISLLCRSGFAFSDAQVQVIADAIEYTAIALIIIGNCIAPVGVLKDTVADWNNVRRLRPLWASLTQAVPEVVLKTTLRRRPRVRLHRVVIEIRDAARALSAYMTVELRDRAHTAAAPHGHENDRLALITEALCLKAARQARLDGLPALEEERASSAAEQPRCLDLEGTDFDAEVERLVQLSIAYHSPTVNTFAAQLTTAS